MFGRIVIVALAAALLAGCQTVYYNTMEKFGVHKREILVDRVAEARDAEHEAKEQFASALERFRSVVKVDGGDLEEKYDQLKAELDRGEAKAEEVRDRIRAVEDVAEALFDEWEEELGQYSSKELQRKSRAQLQETRTRYQRMLRAMKRAEARLEPVLRPLRDQVLFLKHNLNARAIAALDNELVTIRGDVDTLVAELEAAIREADRFIVAMEGGQG